MNHNIKPSAQYPLKGQVGAQSVAAAGTVTSGWIDARLLSWLLVLLSVGAGGGTAALKVEQATSAAGAGAKDLYTAADMGITAQAPGQVTVDKTLGASLDVDNGYAFVRLSVTVTGGTGTVLAALALAGPEPFGL